MFRAIIPCLLAAGLASLVGCQTCKKQTFAAGRAPSCNQCNAAVPGRLQPMPAPAPAPVRQPPAVIQPPIARADGPEQAGFLTPAPRAQLDEQPGADPLGSQEPPPARAQDSDLPPSPPGPEDSSSFSTPPARLLPPTPYRRDVARIPVPDSTKEPPVSVPQKPAPKVEEKTDERILIPGFQIAIAEVATGLKPFPEGVALLKKRGYRTVLHLSDPYEDTDAIQALFKRAGIHYLKLEVSAVPLATNRKLFDEFVRIVEDKTNGKLYVFDKDSSVAGALWFLYFQVHKKYTNEKAQAEAQRLGLQFGENAEESHKTMRAVIERFLSKYKP